MLFPDLAALTEWGFLALRIVIGVIFVVHGLPKLTGAEQAAEAMSGRPNSGLATMITIQGVVEIAGGALLALGVLTQIVAIPLGLIMIGATYLKQTKWKTGFYSQTTTGWEFDLLILSALVLLFLAGPGALALQT